MEKLVTVRVDEHIAVLTINRPEALNAINKQVMKELHEFFTAEYGRDELYGVIITGSGSKAFAAGADIKEFEALSLENARQLSAFGHTTYDAIENFHVPVIAAVNGFALGGGCELAMACHLRIAGEKARFGQPEVNLGLIPGYGGTQRLVHLIGRGKALEFLLTGDVIGADEALRLGLANHVVPEGEEVNSARKIIEKIGTKGPLAVQKVIQTVNAAHADKRGYELEIAEFGTTMVSAEGIEGAAAFVEKRKADFRSV